MVAKNHDEEDARSVEGVHPWTTDSPHQLTKSLRKLSRPFLLPAIEDNDLAGSGVVEQKLTHEQEEMLDALKVESERDDIERDKRSKWGARGPLSTSRHAYGAYRKGNN